MRSKMNFLTLCAITLFAGSVAAQGPPETGFFVNFDGAAGVPMQARTNIAMKIDSMDADPIKGAPFCATVNTEHTQSLSDGNRIHTTNSSQMCRDSEGRIRREAGLNLMGAAPQGSTPKLITIVDPVAGVRYLLDADSKTAQKSTLPHIDMVTGHDGPGAPGKGEHIMIVQHSGGAGPDMEYKDVFVRKTMDGSDEPAPATENLGDQTMDGIHVTGTRVTTTIPAGKMGNEKPIKVTSERWFSPELKVTMMTKHDDPWAGELKTEFKNVNTSEPDSSLFTVPADYKIIDDKDGPIRIQLRAPGPPPQ
jgi:hypothetical protein